jgi:hypothetical protein
MRALLARVSVLSCFLFVAYSSAYAQIPNPFAFPGSASPLAADFNGDGKPDIVRADGSVFLNNGDGIFSQGTDVSVGNIVATGDFNGDGKADLLAETDTSLYILLGNGDGTFQVATPITMNIGAQVSSIVVVADVNGDGKADVLGTNGSQLFVFLGRGDGTFGTATTYSPFANQIRDFVVADFNGDGKQDIALAGITPNVNGPVGVMLGNGDGTFGSALVSTGVTNPLGMAAGDFNGDGKLDLAISGADFSNFGEQTYILLGNGDGTFKAPGSPVPGNGFVSAVDLNGDGKLDLVVWASPFIETFLGNGNGTFSPKATYPEPVAQPAGALAIADFNGDGKIDITDGNLVLFGKGDGRFQNVPALTLNILAASGPTGPADGPILTSMAAGDFNGDGITDLAVGLNGSNANIYILMGDGTGEFSMAHEYSVASSPGPYALNVADFNGDGKSDLFFATNTPAGGAELEFSVMLGNGDGSFGVPIVSLPGTFGTMALADFNGDHIPDIASIDFQRDDAILVLLGNGDGTFGAPVSYYAGPQVNTFVTGDFNRDGRTDLVSCSMAGIGVLLGKGDGTFQSAAFPDPPPPPPTRDTFATLQCFLKATGDFNGDGIPDLIVNEYAADGNVLLGNGDGTFTTLPTQTPNVTTVAVADINGDGKLDLVASDGVTVTFGNGDGTFSGGMSFLPPWLTGETITNTTPYATPGSSIFAIGDFNGDHLPDAALLAPAVPGGVITLLNTLPPPSPDFLVSAALVGGAGVVPGSSVGSEVTLTPVGTFSENVTLSCSGLPTGTSCSFAPSSLPGATGKSALTITTAASTAAGTYPILIVGTSSSLVRERMVALTVATTAGGTNANVLPGIFTFASQITGTSSAAQVTTLTNTGSAALNIASVSIAGANGGDFVVSSNTCSSSIAGFASCQISVTFTPMGMGARSAALSVIDNATGSPQMVALSGTGEDFSLSAGTTSATVTAGQAATYLLSLGAGGGFSGNVALTCSGAPTTATCNVSPAMVSVGGATAATATVSVATTARSELPFPVGNRSPRDVPVRPIALVAALMAMLVLAWISTTRKNQRLRWAPVLTMVLVLVLGITLTSCGGGSSGGGGGGTLPTGTQAGTYTITVSASATSGSTILTHAAKLTLVVQ